MAEILGFMFLVFLVGVATTIMHHLTFFFVSVPILVTFLYTRARWVERDAVHKRWMISTGFPGAVMLICLAPVTLLVFLFASHPVTDLCGREATDWTLPGYYLQGLSVYYGFFSFIGIFDEIVGFLFKQPVENPSPCLEFNLFLGVVFLIVGIVASVWGATYGLPGHVFSHQFIARYRAIMNGSLAITGWDPRWPLIHYAIVCGPFFILIGVWRTLAGIKTPSAMSRKAYRHNCAGTN